MKTTIHLALCLLLVLLFSCKKEEEIYPEGYSSHVREIVSPRILEDLSKAGVPLHPGLNPPNIQGIWYVAPIVIVADWDPNDQTRVGELCACNGKIRFKNQSADRQTAEADWKLGNDDPFNWTGAVSGEGNKFTFFTEWSGTFRGDDATFVTVLSGELSPAGIVNYHETTYIKEKGKQPNNAAVVGQFRVRSDPDGLSEPTSTF